MRLNVSVSLFVSCAFCFSTHTCGKPPLKQHRFPYFIHFLVRLFFWYKSFIQGDFSKNIGHVNLKQMSSTAQMLQMCVYVLVAICIWTTRHRCTMSCPSQVEEFSIYLSLNVKHSKAPNVDPAKRSHIGEGVFSLAVPVATRDKLFLSDKSGSRLLNG